jgi:hypothetical protein
MYEIIASLLIFACLVGASIGSLLLYEWMPLHHRQDDTHAVVRSVANIFVVMTSLVVGLMINSSKNTFEQVDHNVHTIATDMILLDRILVGFGPQGVEARQRLLAYALRAAQRSHEHKLVADSTSEAVLGEIGKSLKAIKPDNADQTAQLRDAEAQYVKVVQLRWIIVEQSEGTIPTPILVMLVAWLVLIFASFGYRAPRNAVVVGSFIVASALIAGAMYLILDMDVPFDGPIQVSNLPLQRAIAEMHR